MMLQGLKCKCACRSIIGLNPRRFSTMEVVIEGKVQGKCGSSTYRRIYLDNQATTPIDPRVLDAMMPYLTCSFGNPHSRTHSFGWDAEHATEKARNEVASLINCKAKNIIFTSGATESNNLAIKGAAAFYGNLKSTNGKALKNHLITSQIDHKCVLQACRQLENDGYQVTYLKPNEDGIIYPQQIRDCIRPETFLCSIIHVNNEIGVIQDIHEMGHICNDAGVLFHTDAAQSFGKIPIDLQQTHVDLLSISGHKIYGPKGIGALYTSSSKPRVRLRPIIDGGGQERGLRSGTIPTPLVVGLGTAAKVAQQEIQRDLTHVKKLYDRLLSGLHELKHIKVNGSQEPNKRYFGNLNVSFEFVEGESLLMSLDNIALSSGSACTTSSLEPSYVLRSLGINEEVAHTSIRFGMGRFTSMDEIERVLKSIKQGVNRLRNLSPLYEMHMDSDSSKTVWV